MPNLVVYVPTSLWRRIEEMGLADPKIEARKVARGALESWLSEGAGANSGEADVPEGGTTISSAPSESRPTPANCGMSNRHFIYSKLKPCPRCGYPL